MPSGDIYPQTIISDGRRSVQQRAEQGKYVACMKNKGIPRHYRPIASTATRCCHCSSPSFWSLGIRLMVVLRLEGLWNPFFLIYPLLAFTCGVAQPHIPEEKASLIPGSFGSQRLAAAWRRFLGGSVWGTQANRLPSKYHTMGTPAI